MAGHVATSNPYSPASFRGQQKIANVVLFIALLKELYSY